MCPDSENPSRTSSDTRLVLWSHLTPTQLQGLSSSSFHDMSLAFGSWIPALNTIKPRTSSLKTGSKQWTIAGARRTKRTTSLYSIFFFKLPKNSKNNSNKINKNSHFWQTLRDESSYPQRDTNRAQCSESETMEKGKKDKETECEIYRLSIQILEAEKEQNRESTSH